MKSQALEERTSVRPTGSASSESTSVYLHTPLGYLPSPAPTQHTKAYRMQQSVQQYSSSLQQPRPTAPLTQAQQVRFQVSSSSPQRRQDSSTSIIVNMTTKAPSFRLRPSTTSSARRSFTRRYPSENPLVELEMHIAENRWRTFVELEWDRRVTDVAPRVDLLVESGFVYTGENDSVLCFWRGLGLDHWERGDVPDMEHTRFSPRCSWLLRHIGRPAVRRLLINDMQLSPQLSPESIEHAEKEHVGILRHWDEMRGMRFW